MDTDNYRGITISSCLGKIFAGVMNKRLINFLSINDVLCENQAGFRPKFRTTDHIFVLSSIIRYFKKKHRPLFTCFIDLSKAYDRINHCFLWYKLLNSEISGKFIRLVRNMYKQSKSCVKVNACLSEYFDQKIGLRQGCVLSPMLFNIFINDLAKFLNAPDNDPVVINGRVVTLLLFADDLVVFAQSAKGLQNTLDRVHAFCQRWHLLSQC